MASPQPTAAAATLPLAVNTATQQWEEDSSVEIVDSSASELIELSHQKQQSGQQEQQQEQTTTCGK